MNKYAEKSRELNNACELGFKGFLQYQPWWHLLLARCTTWEADQEFRALAEQAQLSGSASTYGPRAPDSKIVRRELYKIGCRA